MLLSVGLNCLQELSLHKLSLFDLPIVHLLQRFGMTNELICHCAKRDKALFEIVRQGAESRNNA